MSFFQVPKSLRGFTQPVMFVDDRFHLSVSHEFADDGQVFFVHFRDIEGTKEHFRETFHDNGMTDMARILKVYAECGFNGPMRPDHAPTMEGESNDRPGYAMNGKVFAFGYMRGILDASGYPSE